MADMVVHAYDPNIGEMEMAGFGAHWPVIWTPLSSKSRRNLFSMMVTSVPTVGAQACLLASTHKPTHIHSHLHTPMYTYALLKLFF